MAGYSFHLAATGPTRRRCRTLDAVASTAIVDVRTVDAGIYDNHAVCWHSKPVLSASTSQSSLIPYIKFWFAYGVNLTTTKFELLLLWHECVGLRTGQTDWLVAALYNDEVEWVLEQLIPLHASSGKRRPSDQWFDVECRAVKRITCRIERRSPLSKVIFFPHWRYCCSCRQAGVVFLTARLPSAWSSELSGILAASHSH